MPIARAVCAQAFEDDSQLGAAVDAFDHLNDLRVAFKHRGNLPDVSTNYQLFSEVVDFLDILCDCIIGKPLVQIDQLSAVSDASVRDILVSARTWIGEEKYKEALETVSRALSDAFKTLNVPPYMRPGKVSTEDALLLSGRGIDPASFLTMQKFLPLTYDGDEFHWNLRENGHEMNWTESNANFCLQMATSTILRLQNAQEIPTPSDFYTWFHDVVEVTVATPTVLLYKGGFGMARLDSHFNLFRKGSRISGRVKGSWRKELDLQEMSSSDLEHVPYIVLESPKHDLIPQVPSGLSALFERHFLLFVADEVTISYESNGMREAILRRRIEQGE